MQIFDPGHFTRSPVKELTGNSFSNWIVPFFLPAGDQIIAIFFNKTVEFRNFIRAILQICIHSNDNITLSDSKSLVQSGSAVAAELGRTRWRPVVGDHVDKMSDAEMMDSLDYTLFPNFHPWGAFNRIVYLFRPNGDDHRSAIMEVTFLSPFTGERPPPAAVHWLQEGESFSSATELSMLGKVFDQDLFNMSKVQLGLETTFKPGITLGNYQESKVRWLHQKLTDWVEQPAGVTP